MDGDLPVLRPEAQRFLAVERWRTAWKWVRGRFWWPLVVLACLMVRPEEPRMPGLQAGPPLSVGHAVSGQSRKAEAFPVPQKIERCSPPSCRSFRCTDCASPIGGRRIAPRTGRLHPSAVRYRARAFPVERPALRSENAKAGKLRAGIRQIAACIWPM